MPSWRVQRRFIEETVLSKLLNVNRKDGVTFIFTSGRAAICEFSGFEK
jgi:hypothetical protein